MDPRTHELASTEHTIHLVEVFIGVFIGAITFTGSIVAWGKLEGKIRSKPLLYPGRHAVKYFIIAGLYRIRSVVYHAAWY